MRGVAIVVIAVAGAACSFSKQLASETADGVDAATVDGTAPPPDARPPDFHLRIEALIDGESHLHIKGTTVWWEHFIFAAPGRWDTDAAAPWDVRPIRLDDVDWLPTWPDQPNPENRSCNGCVSSSTELRVGVPRAPSTTTWTEVQTRRAQGIIQYPAADNDWELIVLISDYMVGGAAPYIVEIDVKVD